MSSSTAASMASRSTEVVNQQILRVLHQQSKINKELPDLLKSAAKAFHTKSYNTAAKYFKTALDSKTKDGKLDRTDEQSIVLIRYMLCACWLESTDAKDLLDALQALEELVKKYDTLYPMIYYAVGKAYFKLYRFAKAKEMLTKAYSLLENEKVLFVPYCIPGSEDAIPESTRKGFMVALTSLNEQCFPGCPPDAVCCWVDCSVISYNEGVDKSIFFGSPTFAGMIRVTCNHPSDPCLMCFHVACWKAKKESLDLPKKISPKELGHLMCFTPNCVDGKGERSTLKKVEVFNDQACVKSMIEARADDALKHTKIVPTLKGAVKKQQQQPKLKVSNENRPPLARTPRPPVPKDSPKVNGNEEEDDLNDEQALMAAIEKLNELRRNNFGLNDDKIWRPNLPMYGSEYMKATADLLPDPNFPNDTTEDEEKAFIFSYMFALISENGPMKMDRLKEKWKEAQQDVIEKKCEYILEHHVDIADFLTQSLKFAIVGDYICTADKLAEAYALLKNDVSETVKFFMDNDVDQRSTSSSLDDEAVFNDIINHEKNNGALVHPAIPDSAKILNEEPYGFIDASSDPIKDIQNKFTNRFDEEKNIPELEQRPEALGFLDLESASHGHPLEITGIKSIPNGNTVIENESGIPELLLEVGRTDSLLKTNMNDRSYTPEIPTTATVVTSTKNTDIMIEKTSPTKRIHRSDDGDPPKNVIKGAHSVENIEHELRVKLSTLKLDKLARETKSTNDLKNRNPLFEDRRERSMENGVNADEWPTAKKPTAKALPAQNTKAPKSTALEPDVHPTCTDNSKSIAEMEELREKLDRSKKESEKLKLEIERLEKEHTASKEQLLKRILRGQYDYNKSIITAKLNEWRNNYKLVSHIQQLVNAYTGQSLRINESEMLTIVGTVEEMAANLEARFAELLEQLSASTENGNPQDVNLPPEKMPKLPNCDIIELLKSAFDMCRKHHLKELQKLPPPQAQRPFMPPPYGQVPYNHGNPQNNIPSPLGSVPQPNYMFMPGTQPTGPLFPGFPIQAPPIGPQPFFYQQNSMNQQTNRHMRSTYGPPIVAQNSPTLNAYDANTISKADQSKLPFAKKTQPSLSNSDAFTGQSSDRAQTDSSQQSTVKSDSEQKLKSTLRQLEDLSMKIAASQSPPTPAPTTSDVRESADENCNAKPQIPDSIVNPDISQSKTSTQQTEEAAATDVETTQDIGRENATSIATESKSYRYPGRSLDRLMGRLRSCYPGVLELDLLKSIECVRKQRKSLSGVTTLQIIRDVDKYIAVFQQKQLCGYSKPQPNPIVASRSSTPSRVSEDERPRRASVSSSSSMASVRREQPPTIRPKKQWEPVVIPNDGWTNTEESKCSICFETMENTELCTLRCKHSFHGPCIRKWYKKQVAGEWVIGSCPLCRLHSPMDNEYPPLPSA